VRRRTPQSAIGAALRACFARNVRYFRRSKGMTQTELASAAGVGRCFISQIERQRFSVTLETVGAISAALGVCPTALIESVDEPASGDLPPYRRLPERAAISVAKAARAGEPELVGYR